MKGALLTLASVGSVAAQVTIPPAFNQKVGLSPDDPGYQTCTQIDGILSECIASVGGTNAFATADPDVVIGCLCCASSTSLAPYWSACSEYISEEFPRSSTMYDAYGTVYMGCSMSASCGGGGGGGSGSSATADSDSSATTTESEESTITSGSSSAATDSAGCDDMLSLYSSCAAETDNFNRQPFRSQAACYCCRGRGNSMTWTDELDQYAQTCADWAEDESPETYSVAATFTSFCEHFSDVCAEATTTATEDDAESTSTDEAESTDDGDSSANATGSEESTSSNPTDPVTVTRTDGPEPTETGAAAHVRVGAVAALVFGAVVMVL